MKSILLAAIGGTLLVFATHELVEKHELGSVIRTTFSYEGDSMVVERHTLVNGEEGSGMPDIEQSQSKSSRGVFVDRKSAVQNGLLTGFSREYLDLSETSGFSVSGPMVGDMERSSERTSALEGSTVNFVFEDGDFIASFSDEGAGEELLVGLEANLPWAGFLPEGDVAVDDEWELDPSVVWRAMNLGGDLSLVIEADDGDGPKGVRVFESPTGLDDVELDGEVKASLIDIHDKDGQRLAEIALTVDFSKFVDMPPLGPGEGGGGPEMQSMEIDVTYEGEGVLLWDLDGGYPVSLRLDLESQETLTMLMLQAAGPEPVEIEQTIVSEGKFLGTIRVEVERE